MPCAFHGKSLSFTDSQKKFGLEVDILDMVKKFITDAFSIEQPKDKTHLVEFLDDMRFGGNRITIDEISLKLINSPAMGAGFFKKSKSKPKGRSTKFSSSYLDELCDRLKLLR